MPYLVLPNAKHLVYYDKRTPQQQNLPNDNENDDSTTTAIVFMHHATGSQLDWRDQMSFFSSHTPFQCIAYDRFGFGQSIPEFATRNYEATREHVVVGAEKKSFLFEQDEYHKNGVTENSLEYYNKGLLELCDVLEQLNLQRIILVGHSDGATLSLLAASGQGSTMGDWKLPESARSLLKERIVAVVAESPHMWFDETTLQPGFDFFEKNVESTDRFWKATTRDQLTEHYSKIVVNRWKKTWVNNERMKHWDERECLPHIECPTLVIHGTKDPFFTVDHSKTIVDLINRNDPHRATLTTFDQAAHTPHREQIAPFNSTVLSFINKHKNKLLRIL